MQQHGVKFLRKFVPVMVQQLEKGSPGKLKVTAKSTEGPETIEGVYNTVLLAIGRDSCTRNIGLEKIGVRINEKNGKIPVNDVEQTNVPYVYAVGDVLEGKPSSLPWPSRQASCWREGSTGRPQKSVIILAFQQQCLLL